MSTSTIRLCRCTIVIDHAGECASLALYHVSEDQCARLTDRVSLVVLDPVMRTVSLAGRGSEGSASPASAGRDSSGGAAGAASGGGDATQAAGGNAATATGEGGAPASRLGFKSIQVTSAAGLLVDGRVLSLSTANGNLSITAFDR